MPINLSTFLESTFQGSQGIQGTQGSGSPGTQGSQGTQGVGSDGAQGAQGTLGSQGAQGTLGAQGIQGTSGAQGIQGTSGAQGASGAQGSQGASGAQGIAGSGSQGAQGTQGFSPVGIPSSTNTVLTSTDAGKHINTTVAIAVSSNTGFSTGDMCTIYNSGVSTIGINTGTNTTGVTLRFAGTTTVGNRFLNPKGLGNILCVASNDYVISGAGLT